MGKCAKYYNLGLSGGVGCGKSFVRQIFEDNGFRSIDTDSIAKNVLSEDPIIIKKVTEHFGKSILNENGSLNRSKLGHLVFNHPNDLKWLESLLHPIVRHRWQMEVEDKPQCNWIVEIPLLFEKSLENYFDFSLCVSCSRQQQVRRLLARGYTASEAHVRISRQIPLAEKRLKADFVISNNGSGGFTRSQVTDFLNTILK